MPWNSSLAQIKHGRPEPGLQKGPNFGVTKASNQAQSESIGLKKSGSRAYQIVLGGHGLPKFLAVSFPSLYSHKQFMNSHCGGRCIKFKGIDVEYFYLEVGPLNRPLNWEVLGPEAPGHLNIQYAHESMIINTARWYFYVIQGCIFSLLVSNMIFWTLAWINTLRLLGFPAASRSAAVLRNPSSSKIVPPTLVP